MDLFTPIISEEKQHPLFKLILDEKYTSERQLLSSWAEDFIDRDGKFVQEFQRTFESCLWELYLFQATKVWGFEIDKTVTSPDFVVTSPLQMSIEATIAAPAIHGKPAFGYDPLDIPDEFEKFNAEASIRICNSFTSKVKRHRNYYASLPNVKNNPFVIGIAAFDRPYSHFAAGRSVIASMYGIYYDEELTPDEAEYVISYNVDSVAKSETTDIPMGMFCNSDYEEVSAVIYSSLVTWGKIRALANNPTANTIYKTLHTLSGSKYPEIRESHKKNYKEHLLDGLMLLHNPYARNPLPKGILSHPRMAEISLNQNGDLRIVSPNDFLLVRMLMSISE